MPRGLIIALGICLWGTALCFGSVKLPGFAGREPWMTIVVVASFVIVGVVMILVTRRALPPVEYLSLEEMEKMGLLIHEKNQVTYAFQMEEFADEGAQHIIELKNGTVLFLCGRYLYEYTPDDGWGRTRQPGKFPFTEFAVLHHNEYGWIVDAECGGTMLEPECAAVLYGEEEPSADGDILPVRGRGDIKQALMKSQKA